MVVLEWNELVLIGLAVFSLCGFFWREGRLSGFDKGIKKGLEIGRGDRPER